MANGTITNGASKPGLKAKPNPPAPPGKRPAGRKLAPPPAPRDSAVSMGGSSGGSGRETPDAPGGAKGGGVSLAGGLAEALRQRQLSMQGKKDDDDDDW